MHFVFFSLLSFLVVHSNINFEYVEVHENGGIFTFRVVPFIKHLLTANIMPHTCTPHIQITRQCYRMRSLCLMLFMVRVHTTHHTPFVELARKWQKKAGISLFLGWLEYERKLCVCVFVWYLHTPKNAKP